jgi:hypothetical protein
LTSPANGANFTAPANITLAPSITANGHAIASVQFYNGATLLGQDAVSPYSMVWSNVAGGSYSLTARVVYDGTSTVDSGPANITVAGTNGAVVLKHKINSSKHSVLSGTGQASRTFDVQASSNLKTWTTIGSGTTASDGSFQWTDPTVATNKVRMYRFVAH